MPLDLYKYHSNPIVLLGIDPHIASISSGTKIAQFLTNGMYATHPEKFTKFTEFLNKVFDDYINDSNVSPLVNLTDYVISLPGVAEKFKNKIKEVRLTDINNGMDLEAVFKMLGTSAESYADTNDIYNYLNISDRFDECISKQYFEDIERAVRFVWGKRRFSIYSVVPYLQQSPEMKKYITKDMLDDVTDNFDKQILRDHGISI